MDPRVGRRKRNPKPDEGGYRTPVLESEQLVEIMDAIQDSPWAIVAVKGSEEPIHRFPLMDVFFNFQKGNAILPLDWEGTLVKNPSTVHRSRMAVATVGCRIAT